MISICTQLFSVDGHFMFSFKKSSDLDTIQRRVTKYLTTDGGAEFFDGGWSNSDRTMTVKTGDVQAALRMKDLAKIHQKWTASWAGEFAHFHLDRISISGDEATIELMGDY